MARIKKIENVIQAPLTITEADCGGVRLEDTSVRSACNCSHDCHGGSHYVEGNRGISFEFHVIPESILQEVNTLPDYKWNHKSLPQIKSLIADLIKKENRAEFLRTHPAAILSTTVLPLDGIYRVTTLPAGEIPDLSGIPHYVGHPDTKAIVESLGAIPAPTKLFAGLQPGESAVCFPIAQGQSTRATEGHTNPHQAADLSMLSVRMIWRLLDNEGNEARSSNW